MPSKVFRSSFRIAVIAFAFAGTARAEWLSACASCQGSRYLLQYDPQPVLSIGDVKVWDVFLAIDATGYNGVETGQQAYIRNVAIKIANTVDGTHSSLIDAPGGVPGAWTLQLGGQNAKGCSGSGSGWLCAAGGQTAPVHPATPAVAIYTWEFHYATWDPLFIGPNGASIKAEYVTPRGAKIGDLVSAPITLEAVPDGGITLVLLGGTLLGLETLRKRYSAQYCSNGETPKRGVRCAFRDFDGVAVRGVSAIP